MGTAGLPLGMYWRGPPCCRGRSPGLYCPGIGVDEVTLSKLECSKQAYALNIIAWDNTTGLWPIVLVCRTGVMIKRDSRGSGRVRSPPKSVLPTAAMWRGMRGEPIARDDGEFKCSGATRCGNPMRVLHPTRMTSVRRTGEVEQRLSETLRRRR